MAAPWASQISSPQLQACPSNQASVNTADQNFLPGGERKKKKDTVHPERERHHDQENALHIIPQHTWVQTVPAAVAPVHAASTAYAQGIKIPPKLQTAPAVHDKLTEVQPAVAKT